MKKRNSETLETFIHTTLRNTPAPSAPTSLEQRVLAQLARQAARPWWQQSFHQWPMAVRTVFLILSAALAGFLIIWSVEWLRHGVMPSLLAGWNQTQTSGIALYQVLTHYTSHLSSTVWYVLAGVGVALGTAITVVLGCSAAAYRFLWKNA